MILLSYKQAGRILEQLPRGQDIRVSLDLGRTETLVQARGESVHLSRHDHVSVRDLQTVADNRDAIFAIERDSLQKVIRFSSATQRVYTLRPTETWPALEISGILMHPVKGTDPKRDAESKVALVSPVRGSVLDTCCGLGYTAIIEARTADVVTVIEKDATVLDLARLNPYSRGLFETPRIKLIHGDATEVVPGFEDGSFDIINHDPPTLGMAGDLYADVFYEHLWRVLRPGGKLLHYVGTPGSKHRRIDLATRVAHRLGRIGFTRIRKHKATGCICGRRSRN